MYLGGNRRWVPRLKVFLSTFKILSCTNKKILNVDKCYF